MSESMSSGNAIMQGPGVSLSARWKARATTSGLERPAAAVGARHLADQQHQRHRVLLGHVHRDRGVGGAGAAADRADPGAAGDLGIRQRHETGAALVAGGDQVDVRRVVQRVQERQVALAGHAEDAVDAVGAQAFHHDIGGAPGIAPRGHGRFSPPIPISAPA
jgi:hypothetical protein